MQAQQKCFRVLSDYLHLLERWETVYAPKSPEDGWNPLFVEAMQKREYVGYLLDTLLAGTKEEKAAVIKEHGKEVERIGRRVSEFAASGKTSRGDSRRQPER